MREFSTPIAVEIADAANLADIVFSRAAAEPDRTLLRRKTDASWRDVTAGQFGAEVARLAKGLVAAGIEPGERVALMSRTRYEWTLIDYAIWAAGAVTVPVYETSSAEQVEWIASDSGARAIFVETEQHEDLVTSATERLADIRDIWCIDDGAPAGLAERGSDVSDGTLEERRGARGASDVATIIYTSGTTGRPKGCVITHGNMLADVRNATEGAFPELFDMPGASTLLFLPLAHSFARVIQVGCVQSGTILGHSPDIANVLPDLESYAPTFLLAVPRVFEKVYNGAEQKARAGGRKKIFRAAADTAVAYSKALDSGRPGLALRARHLLFDRLVYGKMREAVGGRVQYAVSGGSALGQRLGHFFRGAGITILEGYGLTEATAAATVNIPDKNKIGTVGRPLPGCAIRIDDDGQILLAGPNVFGGYWNDEKATKESFDDSGWFRSGDLGEIDGDGYLSVTGRKKEIIVTAGGKNVAPAALEDRLRAHPLVGQCMVVGDDRPFISCLVTLDPEALEVWKSEHGEPDDATAARLRDDPRIAAGVQAAVDDANGAVSQAESIKKFHVLEIDFTTASGYLTPSLKVRRDVIARDFADEIERLYR